MRRALVLVLLLLSASAGCLASRTRTPLPVGGELARLDLFDAPILASGAHSVAGVPVPDAQGVAVVRLVVPDGAHVELTDFTVRGERGDDVFEGQVAQVALDPATTTSQGERWRTMAADGTNVTLHFRLVDEDLVPLLPAGRALDITVEVWWKYDVGAGFDAGRVRLHRNVTPEAALAEGARPEGAELQIWGAGPQLEMRLRVDAFPSTPAAVRAFAVGGDGAAASALLLPDPENERWSGTLNGTAPARASFGVAVAPWPLPTNATQASFIAVVGPDGIKRFT